MNSVRDLWDTVVLRDVLGYVVPGAVTLLVVGLLLLALLVLPLAPRAPHYAIAGVLSPLLMSHRPLVCSYPWLIAAVVIPLCFVIGHVQGQLVAFLGDHCVRWWNLGALALDFLTEDAKRGGDHADAALRVLAGIDGGAQLLARCAEKKGRFKELCCCLKQARLDGKKNRCAEEAQATEKKAECEQAAREQARDLWYLCNHYVLNESPRLHAMWIGRYYVLAILFSNLFLSFVLPLLLLPTVGLLLLLPAVSLLLLRLWSEPDSIVNASSQVWPVASHALAILSVFGLVAAVIAIIWMCSLLLCSREFHRAYVERTFPIFYVLIRQRGQTHQDQGRRGAGKS